MSDCEQNLDKGDDQFKDEFIDESSNLIANADRETGDQTIS